MNRARRRFYEKRAKKERAKIAPEMRKLRDKALKKYGERHRVIVAGWSFLVDVGAQHDDIRKSPKVFAETMKSFCRLDLDPCNGKCGEDHQHWHLSARVNPHTRGSSDEDWRNLGIATGVFGVPESAAEMALEQVKDNAWVSSRAIHHHWTESLDG